MEQTECSETSAYKIQTPGNYPEESIQHTEHGESLKSRITLEFVQEIILIIYVYCGTSSSVSIATDYGLDGPGIESRWGRDFPPAQIGPGAHPASWTMGTGSFPGVKCGRGVLLTTHRLLEPRSWKSRATPPLGHNRAYNGVTLHICLFPIEFMYEWCQLQSQGTKGSTGHLRTSSGVTSGSRTAGCIPLLLN